MKRWSIATFVVVLLGGCHHRPKTPEEAFVRLERAVAADDAKALYQLLDKETRWAVLSTYNDQRLQRTIISAKYPEREALEALARLKSAAEPDVTRFFASYCHERRLIEQLPGLLGPANGALTVEQRGPDECVMRRSGGSPVSFHRERDGSWGFSNMWTVVWLLERDRASHAIKTVRDNAALYQRAGQKAGSQ
jgi:hypothetical protein